MTAGSRPDRRPADQSETVAANRSWWDAEADTYHVEHGTFLGDAELIWGPEGWRESELQLLGDVSGCRVLEFGAGAAMCARWLATQGATVVAGDLSRSMLRTAQQINSALAEQSESNGDVSAGPAVPLLQCDAVQLPFVDEAFDIVFTSYGAIPFVADSAGLMRESARVLCPGGRFVFSTTHPMRWAFADDPGRGGLNVIHSYFDRTPYVEVNESGRATYVEHHRTMGDRVREIVAAGLVLDDVVELEWPARNAQTWGGWSPLRGQVMPGTAVFVSHKPI